MEGLITSQSITAYEEHRVERSKTVLALQFACTRLNNAHGNCLQLWSEVVQEYLKSDISAKAWSSIKARMHYGSTSCLMSAIYPSHSGLNRCVTQNRRELLIIRGGKEGYYRQLPIKVRVSLDSVLAFTTATVTFLSLWLRFYGVPSSKSTSVLPIPPYMLSCASM